MPGSRCQGRRRDRAGQRLGRVDREAVHLERRQGHRLRPPGQRRLGRRSTSRSTARPSARRRPRASSPRFRGQESAKPVVAELWGGPTDQNAFWFKSGNDAVLNPLFASRHITKGPQQFVPDWLATNAAPIFAQMLIKTNNKIDAAIAANDGIAGAVVATLKARHLQSDPAERAGRDGAGRAVHPGRLADRHGVQVRARRGERCSSGCGRAPQRPEAEVEHDPQERRQERADARALPVIWITKANYKRLFTDGFLKKNDVCIGAVQAVLLVEDRSTGGGARLGVPTYFLVGTPSP